MNIPNKQFLKDNWTGDPLTLAQLMMHPKVPNAAKIYDIWETKIEESDIDKKVFQFARYIMDSEREWNPAPPFTPNPEWIMDY